MSQRVADHGIPRPARLPKVVGFLCGALLLWLLASFLAHPLSHEDSDRGGAPLLQGAEIPSSVADVLAHAWIERHSERTRWPWYSQIAPFSCLVENDVKQARTHLNLSRWDNLDATEQRMLLTAIATVIENLEMPPYRLFQPEAKLSAEDSVRVVEWTRAERRRIRSSASSPTTN